MMKPKKYDLNNPDEIERWFEEMEGYLNAEDFINQATDREGRVFAYEAFLDFKKRFNAALPLMKLNIEKIKKKGESLKSPFETTPSKG